MQTMLDKRVNHWREVRGPMGAAILSARRVGWELISPFVLRTPMGDLSLPGRPPNASRVWLLMLGEIG